MDPPLLLPVFIVINADFLRSRLKDNRKFTGLALISPVLASKFSGLAPEILRSCDQDGRRRRTDDGRRRTDDGLNDGRTTDDDDGRTEEVLIYYSTILSVLFST